MSSNPPPRYVWASVRVVSYSSTSSMVVLRYFYSDLIRWDFAELRALSSFEDDDKEVPL